MKEKKEREEFVIDVVLASCVREKLAEAKRKLK
jgi:hypothetical protein